MSNFLGVCNAIRDAIDHRVICLAVVEDLVTQKGGDAVGSMALHKREDGTVIERADW